MCAEMGIPTMLHEPPPPKLRWRPFIYVQSKLEPDFAATEVSDVLKMKFLKPFIHALAAAAKKLVDKTTASNFVAPKHAVAMQ